MIYGPDDSLAFTISPSVSRLVFHAEEDGVSWLEFVAWYPEENTWRLVRFTLDRLIRVRSAQIAGLGEISQSAWLEEVKNEQKQQYPEFSDIYDDIRHFFVGGHDDGYEFLCKGYQVTIVRDLPNW